MAEALRALVVDDDEALRAIARHALTTDGWIVEEAECGADVAQRVGRDSFDLLLLDQRLPDADGVELLEDLREDGYSGPAVIMTGHPTMPRAIAALGNAASDYLCKPVPPAQFVEIGRQARCGDDTDRSWKYLWEAVSKRFGFSNVLSVDEATRQCYITAARVADSTAPVLIEGETGTGKEYLARAIHYMSDRRDGPFVAVNCGAIPNELLESELFGHEKGAFTSASSAKKGICEMADGGTLLLDEIGELRPEAQVKLLRFLQDRCITRLGGLQPIDVDARVIAATNCDLSDAIRKGKFREDLYYRIAVVSLSIAPVRRRPADIPLFAGHFIKEARREAGRGPTEIAIEAMRLLEDHSWPGNLRELNNVIQRGALLARGRVLRPEHVSFHSQGAPEVSACDPEDCAMSLADVECMHIARVLDHTGDNKSEASRILGIARKTLRSKMTHHGLSAA